MRKQEMPEFSYPFSPLKDFQAMFKLLDASPQTIRCVLHIFIHYFLFASKTEALLHFFFSNNRTFTPSFFILSQQSQRTVLFSSISRKKTLTAPSAATKETIYYSGKNEKPGTLGINTKRRTDFLWIVSGSFRWLEPQESVYCMLASLINSGE